MDINKDIALSAKWLNECNSHINGMALGDSAKNRVSGALLHLALEHHGAIQILVTCKPYPHYGSAAALLRPQFEAYIRGVWYHRRASKQDLEKFVNGDEPPKVNNLIRDLEALPGYTEGKLKSIKKDTWRIMCGLTHGGSAQYASRNSATEIVSNYTDDQVRGVLYWACALTLQVSGAFANFLENNVLGNELLLTYRSLFPEKP